MLAILILAAGQSSRMQGADKLLQHIDQSPLLRVMANRALTTQCQVLVTLPASPGLRRDVISDLPVHTISVGDADKGMAHSIRAGIAALEESCTGVMILPADMPDLSALDLIEMQNAWEKAPKDTVLRGAASDGTPGHPVIFPASCFKALSSLSGDQGAKPLLQRMVQKPLSVPLPGNHALTDLDTPEDWDQWRTLNPEIPD